MPLTNVLPPVLLGLLLSAGAFTQDTPSNNGRWTPPEITLDSALSRPVLALRHIPQPAARTEDLRYAVRYGFLQAGEANLRTEPGPEYGGRPTWRVVGTGRSTGAFDWIFKVRDHYESHVDFEGGFPHFFHRSIREGGYRLERTVQFDPERRTARTEDRDRIRHQALPAFCQDLVSAFHYARQLPLDQLPDGALIEMPIFLDGKVHTVRARKMGSEAVDVAAGTFDCWSFKPVVMSGRIWASEDDLTVYVSSDARRIPVLVKSDLVVGSIRLELTEVGETPTAGSKQ